MAPDGALPVDDWRQGASGAVATGAPGTTTCANSGRRACRASSVEKKQGTLDEPEDAIVRFGRTVLLLPSRTPAVRPLNCANHHECGAVNLHQSEFLIR